MILGLSELDTDDITWNGITLSNLRDGTSENCALFLRASLLPISVTMAITTAIDNFCTLDEERISPFWPTAQPAPETVSTQLFSEDM